jgi:hypothetical protein
MLLDLITYHVSILRSTSLHAIVNVTTVWPWYFQSWTQSRVRISCKASLLLIVWNYSTQSSVLKQGLRRTVSQAVSGFLLRRPGFNLRAVTKRSVVDRVARGRFFASYHSNDCDTIGPFVACSTPKIAEDHCSGLDHHFHSSG